MKVILLGHDYRYAAEQMLMTLFPEERPVYDDGQDENCVRLALHRGACWLTATADLNWHGKTARRSCRARSDALTGIRQEDDRLCQQILKTAFYRAGTELLGSDLPWGAMTGVRPVKIPSRALRSGASPAAARSELRRDYRVSPRRAEMAVDCARVSLDVDRSLMPGDICLYIGIPFCPTRCSYCSFVSSDVRRVLKLTQPYTDALVQEIAAAGSSVRSAGLRVRAVYFGGGTPTTLTEEQLDQIMTALETHFSLEPGLEYTVEAGRPDTITREKLTVLSRHGAGRISVNPQTMEDRVLQAMGRQHTAEQTERAYALVRETGDFIVNMDVIAGLPEDSPAGFRRTAEKVLSMAPENITVHTLAVKRGSYLREQSKRSLPDETQVEDMLSYAWDRLEHSDYRPYYLYRQKFMTGSFENVGWCRQDHISIYNVCMMEELRSVLSLGAGGVTKLIDRDAGSVVRHANPKYPQDYLARIRQICSEKEQLFQPDPAGPRRI
ncbi:MAG: coproporphyrinogen dehydrogenase HemZ [Oscillospiraceae bacterium]|nr:coproporphyrinogen dehydrogenase HemZ [Oscillospiraceae bacterium]